MSALVFVRDGRTLPFVPVTTEALEAIRAATPKGRPYAVTTYMALLEFANEDRSDRVALSQRDIAERVGASRSTVQTALAALQSAGVLNVIERVHANARIENEYVVIEPGAKSCTPARDTGDPPPVTQAANPRSSAVDVVGQSSKKDRAKEIAQKLPDDFPEALKPHARIVFRVLKGVAEQHNAREVTPRGVGLAMQGYPGRRYVALVHDLASWAAAPPRPIKDAVSTYRKFLSDAPAYAGVEAIRVGAEVVPIGGRSSTDVLGASMAAAHDRNQRAQAELDRREAEREHRSAV